MEQVIPYTRNSPWVLNGSKVSVNAPVCVPATCLCSDDWGDVPKKCLTGACQRESLEPEIFQVRLRYE